MQAVTTVDEVQDGGNMSENTECSNGFAEYLSDVKDRWTFDADSKCWCLKNVVYTPVCVVPEAQILSIFVPEAYMKEGGEIVEDAEINGYSAATAPIVFCNNSAGYHQMGTLEPAGGRCAVKPFLEQGYIFVTCGNRGSESVTEDGTFCGKSPANLVDIKTAIRYIRHNKGVIPGDMERIISSGWSAGGAMSTLIGVTGNSPRFNEALKKNGAFMDEKDDVFAAQVYCPIVDLEHADMAYEWAFSADSQSQDSPAGPGEVMTPFKRALSDKLKEKYVEYFNSLNLKGVENGEPLAFGPDGRSGSAYEYYIGKLEESAAEYLKKVESGELGVAYSVENYLDGNYTFKTRKFQRRKLGEARPGAGPVKHEMIEVQGDDKRSWLTWDGKKASISGMDAYVMGHYRRMKSCTSFDVLAGTSGENQVFGNEKENYLHFSTATMDAIGELKGEFPEECEKYYGEYLRAGSDAELKERVYVYNPLSYIGTDEKCDQADHFRICVGAQDADTSHSISMELACRLKEYHDDVIYKIIWDKPHCEADYEGDAVRWIESIVH